MNFIKYHGLGNDFIVRTDDEAWPDPAQASAVCARGSGVGADGLMTAGPSTRARLRMQLRNSDGSTPEMCGNGLRCFVKYAVDELGLDANPLAVETEGGVRSCYWRLGDDGRVATVRVDMGRPSFQRSLIPMLGSGGAERVEIEADGERFVATGVNTGNPHMVIFGDADQEKAARFGPALTWHPLWPEGANVEFARVIGPQRIDVSVWERGCGLTQACGTGATAVVAAAVRLGDVSPNTPVTVRLPGGELVITIESGGTAWMEGPAVEVYRGALSWRDAAWR